MPNSKGMGGRQSIGTVREEFSSEMGRVIPIGSGEQRQGNDVIDDPGSWVDMDHSPDDPYSSQPSDTEITFTKEEGEADYHISRAIDAAEDAPATAKHEEEVGEEKDTTEAGYTLTAEEVELLNQESERVADDGPTDGNINSNNINREKVITIFEKVGGGFDFAPNEGQNTGGMVDPELLQTIRSNQTQVKTVDGVDLNSNNIEDLSRRAQEAAKNQGQGNPVSDY